MPTILGIDSFQHRIIPTAINTIDGFYSAVNNGGTTPNHGGGGITFDTTIKRTSDHACSLKIAATTAAVTNLRRTVATTRVVGSVYFRCDAAPASGSSKIVNMALSAGVASVGIDSSGFITVKVGSGTQQTGNVNYADAAWHRLDWDANTSGATATLDAQVDGNAQTQATLSLASANMTTLMLGDNTFVSADTTIYYNDLCWSQTGADYPLGDHICLHLEIAGTGTHNQGSGAFTDELGNTTDAELLNSVDDAWNGTTPELSQTGEDYVQQTANDAAGYLEFTLSTVPITVSGIWGGQLGILMAAEDSTTACNCTGRLVDSANNSLMSTGSVDPSVSATAYSAYRPITGGTAPSGGWSETSLEGCKVRFGSSTDAAPDVIMNSAIVEYVAPWAGGQTVTGVALSATPSLPAGALAHAITGVALSATPSLPAGSVQGVGQQVDGVALAVTPSLPAGSLNHSLTGVALSATPSLPAGNLNHSLTGVALSAAPSLPAGKLNHSVTGTALSITPSLPAGALTHTLTGVALSATPSLPAGAVTTPGGQTVTGVALAATPSLPAGTLNHSLTGVALSATPSLPAGSLNHSLTGVALTASPTLPAGLLQHSLTGVALTVAPTLPAGALSHSLTGTALTVLPVLPIGTVQAPQFVTGTTLTLVPVLDAGQVVAVVFVDTRPPDSKPNTTVVIRPSLRSGARFNRRR